MARKRFRLEAIWRIRHLVEDKLRRELGMMQMELVQAREKKQQILARREKINNEMQQQLKAGLTGCHLHLVEGYLTALADETDLAELEIKDARKRLIAKRDEVINATRESKVMDNLREKHRARQIYEENYEENKELAEIALNRFVRRSDSESRP